MNKLRISVYIFLFLFLIFVDIKANFTKNLFKTLSLHHVNTEMSISEGNLKGETLKPSESTNGFLKKYKLESIKTFKQDEIKNGHAVLLAECKCSNKKSSHPKKIYKLKELGKFGLIDENGNNLTKFIYKDIEVFDESRSLFKIYLGSKTGLIDIKGTLLLPAKYKNIQKTGNKDVLLVVNSKYYGLYDLSAQDFAANPIYRNIKEIDAHNWKIYSGKYTGLAYSKDNTLHLIKPKYDDIIPYKGIYKTKLKNKEGLISNIGEVITEPIYDSIELINEADTTKRGLLIFKTKVDERYGVIYSSNNSLTVVSPIYEDVKYDKGLVNVLSDGYRRLLDENGNVTTR